MKIKARTYSSVGYQDDGASMPITVIEVELESTIKDRRYTIGRLFFHPDFVHDELGPEIFFEGLREEV